MLDDECELTVALITPSIVENDGQGRVNFEIVRRLLDRGFRFSVAVMRISPSIATRPGVAVTRYPFSRLPALPRTILFKAFTERWLARRRKTVHVVQIDGASAVTSSDINPSHFVHAAWRKSIWRDDARRALWYRSYHVLLAALNVRAERRAYGAAKRVVAVSNHVRSELIAIGVPPEKIAVVALGVDVDAFHPGDCDRSAYGLPDNRLVLAFAGDMTTGRKNLDTVLAALQLLPNVHLAVIGSTDKNPYPAIAAKMGLADRVSFLGFRRDVPEIFRCCDAFVFPSRYEPFGLVVLEALASGIPVISARTTGASDVVTPECGIIIDNPNDVAALAEAIGTMERDRAKLQRMKGAAREVAMQYSWDRVADRFEQLYREAAARA